MTAATPIAPLPTPREHVGELVTVLQALDSELAQVDGWGQTLAARLLSGHRLLAAGNGGSAADAQHLTAELVGRYRDDRRPFSALALHAETSSVTAIANDYDYEHVFARQVEAHGRPGDVLVAISTSGMSGNVVEAARRAQELDLQVWALTGPRPNPLALMADQAIAVEAAATPTVQEVHGVLVHLLCAAVDRIVLDDASLRSRGAV